MYHLSKIILAILVIFSIYYYMDNSLERVQDTTIKNLTYVMLGDYKNPAYKKQQEKRLDIMLNSMERGGFKINENLLKALENNSFIQDLRWNVKERAFRGLDKVLLNFKLVDGEFVVPIKVAFFVIPKPSLMNFFSNPKVSKLYPLLSVEITANEKIVTLTDLKAYETLVTFYSEKACKSLFQIWKNKKQ